MSNKLSPFCVDVLLTFCIIANLYRTIFAKVYVKHTLKNQLDGHLQLVSAGKF